MLTNQLTLFMSSGAAALCMFDSKWVQVAAADKMPTDVEQVDGRVRVAHTINLLLDSQSKPDSQGFTHRMELPLPEAAALWQSRQTIALRALFLLECLQGWLTPGAPYTHIIQPRSAIQKGRSSQLFVSIFQILHGCLSGQEPAPQHTQTYSALSLHSLVQALAQTVQSTESMLYTRASTTYYTANAFVVTPVHVSNIITICCHVTALILLRAYSLHTVKG